MHRQCLVALHCRCVALTEKQSDSAGVYFSRDNLKRQCTLETSTSTGIDKTLQIPAYLCSLSKIINLLFHIQRRHKMRRDYTLTTLIIPILIQPSVCCCLARLMRHRQMRPIVYVNETSDQNVYNVDKNRFVQIRDNPAHWTQRIAGTTTSLDRRNVR